MNIITYALEKPVSVAVAVILVVTFGLIGLNKLPVQLTPDVEKPEITVQTFWNGATPYEIEKEIVEKQEKALKGIQGLTRLKSQSYNNFSEVTLSFTLETDINDALLRVSNKLDGISAYPDNVGRPLIDAAGANASPVIWMTLRTLLGNKQKINTYKTYFDDSVKQQIERVKGVGTVLVFGGTENELQVELDMNKMARYRLSIGQIAAAVNGANATISAGILGIGRKNYRIRTIGQFQNPQDVLNVVVFDDGLKRIYLRDIVTVRKGYRKETGAVLYNGEQVIVIGIRKEPGTNVLSMAENVEREVIRLNETILKSKGLFIDMVYDQRPYINNAINLVKKNVLVGSLLAITVLLIFLRSSRSTLITALAIPISVTGSFIFLWLSNRSLNVVSLAGISFAVGMLVDNSIVVLENIDRHRKLGKTAFKAAYDGTREVRGAIFASTATTVAVFLPVIFMKEEAGQLFRDIAIAITFSILLSFVVSITVIPTLINIFYRRDSTVRKERRLQKSIVGPFIAGGLMKLSSLCLKNLFTRLFTVIFFTTLSVFIIVWLRPSAEYLPQGNRNLILNILLPPPGYSVDKLKELGKQIYQQTKPYFLEDNKDGIPQIDGMFYVGADRFTLFGGISKHETRARELIPLFSRVINSIPGIFGVSIQASVFGRNLGKGRTVEVHIFGEKIDTIVSAARMLYGGIGQQITGARIRPVPSLETSYPEIRIIPKKEMLAANGLTERELGVYVDILMDGRKIDEYRPEGSKLIDLVLTGKGSSFDAPEKVLDATIVNRFGDLIKVGDVASLVYGEGVPQINHFERKRTITLEVTPPADLSLQDAMAVISGTVEGLKKDGKLKGIETRMGGNADKLVETRQALQWNLLLALLITYLLMAALFENFLYPLIILFSVPLAAAGGFIGLLTVHTFVAPQGFDVLAMLGFIILIGTVVNNAILIVHQSLNNIRYHNLTGIPAISEAVRTRIRPIFMSATTSILAMTPLVISTGSGSELYRGLGSILLGGLALSTFFTLFVIPAMLAFVIRFERRREHENN
ncbi:MAG: acriflavin resistance protein [Proteobacteria bacterium]|nr:MAG: acriflavin resistance protein [Pseudomonadota bacterium]